MKHSRCKIAKLFLTAWCLFIGVGALFGGISMLIKPDGSILQMQTLLPYFEMLPFSDVLFKNYIFPGISLLVVNGFTNLTSAYLLIRGKKSGIILGSIFGVTLMAWITIQFIIFPPNFLSISYFLFGICQAVTGYIAFVFYTQEHYSFDKSEYANIGKNKKELVVYFSRMGYTEKAAYRTADKSGAEIYRIESTERTDGTLGFWWCGRYAMHRWRMPINSEKLPDVSLYDKVTVCSPIWAFGIASPVLDFLTQSAGKIKCADYIFIHFMKCGFICCADKADKILGIKREKAVSICCRLGKTVSEKDI